jgi:hypothetical protein
MARTSRSCRNLRIQEPLPIVPNEYNQGDLQCRVLTANGLDCGGEYGQSRCDAYCVDSLANWELRLLQSVMQLFTIERARMVTDDGALLDVTPYFSTAAALNATLAEAGGAVNVALAGTRAGFVAYSGMVTLALDRAASALRIVVMAGAAAASALQHALQEWAGKNCGTVRRLDGGHIALLLVIPDTNMLQVRHAVSLGARLLLTDLKTRSSPVTLDATFALPHLTITSDEDNGDPRSIARARGVVYGGRSGGFPPY